MARLLNQENDNKNENCNKNKSKNKTKYKIRRGLKNKKESLLCMMSANAAQLKGKLNSFKSELKASNSAIFTLQECHYATKGKVQIENFEVFEAIRKKVKGGSMIGIHKALNPILIEEYSCDFELLVVEIRIANKDICIFTGYGPQENWQEADRLPFFIALEQEIVKAELAGKSILMEMDANSKLGTNYIPGDKHVQTENGKLLAGILDRHSLVLGNSLEKCKGLITRKRTTKNTVEESTIDFVIMSEDLKNEVELIEIDDERHHVLTKITRNKNGTAKIESDHNTIFSKFRIPWNKKVKQDRVELYNLKNIDCQKIFTEETKGSSNEQYLSSVFDENGDINTLTQKFLKRLQKTIKKCFKKVRITEKIDKDKEELYKKWKELKKNTSKDNQKELEMVETELAEKYAEDNFNVIKENTEGYDCEDGGLNSGALWSIKKSLFPNCRDPPTAMRDPVSGNLVTNEENIQKVAVNVYKKRLENRPMKHELKHIKDAKEKLCQNILKIAGKNKTPPWTMKDLDKVLKILKKQKSRDPFGLANEIFRPEIAGDDLKIAILKLMNMMKDQQKYPECLELCDISSIWKKKGSRNEFDSYRGIFRVTVFRSILDSLIYNDEYKNIDKNLTDSNVGARKMRNIRDNIFVMNAVLNSNRKTPKQALDCQVYDVEKCFDALWLHEVVNCLFESGLNNDKLPLLFLENNTARIAIKTQRGVTGRVSIQDIIMQGSKWGSLCCVVLMDKLGKMAYQNPELLYYYKGLVGIPPLQMVDDIMALQTCSIKSQKLNTAINTFIELEKLTLSGNKSKNVHIGKSDSKCPNLKVHGNDMIQSKREKYLGDLVDKSGSNKPNFEARQAKGFGIVTNILAIINEIPLGHWRVEAGLRLRQAMFVNGCLFNSEAWHGVKNDEIKLLEKVDECLLRSILNAHSKIPVEALYLETGSVPIRYIISSRRLMYLHSIIQKDPKELVRKVYEAQKEDVSPGDFYELVMEDKALINLELSEDEMKSMKKTKFKTIVKSKMRNAAYKSLKEIKGNHSKMNGLRYDKLEQAAYLSSPMFNTESIRLLLALRTRTVRNIRNDFRGMFPDNQCPLSCDTDDTLQHVLECSVIRRHHESRNVSLHTVRYSDVFSINIKKQKQATQLYSELLEVRENLINQPDVWTRARSLDLCKSVSVLSPRDIYGDTFGN